MELIAYYPSKYSKTISIIAGSGDFAKTGTYKFSFTARNKNGQSIRSETKTINIVTESEEKPCPVITTFDAKPLTLTIGESHSFIVAVDGNGDTISQLNGRIEQPSGNAVVTGYFV